MGTISYHLQTLEFYYSAKEANHLVFFAGTALLISNMMCIAVSGGSMNPARSFGPAVVAGVWKSHWMYWVGPYLGALFSAYYALKTKEEKKEDED